MIAGRLQVLGKRGLAAVKAVEDRHAVDVAILAGKNGRPAWRADRVGHETVRETHAVMGNAVEVWRLVDLAAVATQGMGGVVVGHDVENVGRFRLGGLCGAGTHSQDNGGNSQAH